MGALQRFRPDVQRGLLVNTIAAAHATPDAVRARILQRWGVRIEDDALVSAGCFFGSPDVTIGAGTFVNVDCFFDGSAPITIGRGCNIAMGVLLCTSTHDVGGPDRRAVLPTRGEPVTIGDGCWIGARATILPGVTVAPGCVVAAGAIVTRDTEPNGELRGIPAQRVRDLS
jgi:maltose O-acetyltransferase